MTIFLTFKIFSLTIDNLSDQRAKWEMFTDAVMGGVSTGNFLELNEKEINFYRLLGEVSTKNNGGFIQFRTKPN